MLEKREKKRFKLSQQTIEDFNIADEDIPDHMREKLPVTQVEKKDFILKNIERAPNVRNRIKFSFVNKMVSGI